MASGLPIVAALELERFGNAQAAAVEQSQHRGVARMNPDYGAIAGRQIGIGHALGGGDRQRPRQRLGDLRPAHGGKRADAAFAVAFEKAGEGARAGKCAHQRAAADVLSAPRRHEGAHVGRRERGELFERRRAAEVFGEEGEKLQHVAPVGFERLRRHAPLGAEIRQPAFDLRRDFGGDEIRHFPPPRKRGRGTGLRSRTVEGARAVKFCSLLHVSLLGGAPSTMLRMVPLPRFTGEDKEGHHPYIYGVALYPS